MREAPTASTHASSYCLATIDVVEHVRCCCTEHVCATTGCGKFILIRHIPPQGQAPQVQVGRSVVSRYRKLTIALPASGAISSRRNNPNLSLTDNGRVRLEMDDTSPTFEV
jgi:hypothetical protein